MRKIVSIVLTVIFIVVSITGIQLLLEHAMHEMRHTSGIHLIVRHIHEIAGIVFIISGLIHLKLNLKAILSYIGIKRK